MAAGVPTVIISFFSWTPFIDLHGRLHIWVVELVEDGGSDWDILNDDAGLMKRLLASLPRVLSMCYPFPSGCVFFSILRESRTRVSTIWYTEKFPSPTPISLLLANVVLQYSTVGVGEKGEVSCSWFAGSWLQLVRIHPTSEYQHKVCLHEYGAPMLSTAYQLLKMIDGLIDQDHEQ